jgi:hypothetical protein
MARSGSYDFGITRNEIINAAFRLIGVLGTDQTASATMISEAAESLEMMIKAWQGRGYGLWLNKEIVLFPQADQVKYRIGPTMQSTWGDYGCAIGDYVKTEIATAAVATDTNMTVDSITGATNGDFIGVETDNGDIHWTTINGVPAGTTIVLTTGLDYGAAVGNHVYTGFTAVPQRPLSIIKMWRRDGELLDIDIELVSMDEYRAQTQKTVESAAVVMAAYDKLLDDGEMYLWPEPNDMKYQIHIVAKYPVQDFDGGTNNPDFPQEWYMALKYNLALHIAAEYSRIPSPLVMELAKSSIQDAMGSDTDNTSFYLQPDYRGFRRY